ncbi:hypothetical protein AMJ40_05315, partial [candidate division TA06 bacterium DG_26]
MKKKLWVRLLWTATVLIFICPLVASGTTYWVTNTLDAKPGPPLNSLRWAIQSANTNPGPDTILFNIGGGGQRTISVVAALDTITESVYIDGYTQPGAAPNTQPQGNPTDAVLLIEVTGSGLPFPPEGFHIHSNDVVIRGLCINCFWNGIVICSASSNCHVLGCYVGTDIAGSEEYPCTSRTGVTIQVASHHNWVGGLSLADRNVISGWDFGQVDIVGLESDSNVVVGNYIGTERDGLAQPIMFDNNGNGVSIYEDAYGSPKYNRVGDQGDSLRNVISGNGWEGIEIAGPGFLFNVVENNYIGVNVNVMPLGNGFDGVILMDCTKRNIIGPDNIIANNFQDGVEVIHGFCEPWDDTDFNTITYNSIYDNLELGIDLGPIPEVTLNDPADPDTGQNQEVNFPVIASATYNSGTGQTTVNGTVDIDTDPTQATVELFIADVDPSFHGEGATYLASTAPDAGGNWTIVVSGLTPGDYLTATTTDMLWNTSEFSQCALVAGEEDWYFKPPYENYAVSGMPDIDQKQDNWVNPNSMNWSFCGPVAVANCFMWFDSKFGDPTGIPGDGWDNFPLVRDYADNLAYPPVPPFPPQFAGSPWVSDDHRYDNVDNPATVWPPGGPPPALPPFSPGYQNPPVLDPWGELVERLAWCMDCDGVRTGDVHSGTYVDSMQACIDRWLIEHELDGYFTEVTIEAPTYDYIEAQVERSQNVILLLGFWQLVGGEQEFIRGDVDENGVVDMADYIFCETGPPFSCDDAADVNDNGILEWGPGGADCMYLASFLSGGPPPPPPFPFCGLDPTDDALGCAHFPPCPGGPEEWVRLGGHFLTVAGVSSPSRQIAFSDPCNNNAQAGVGPGRVLGAWPHVTPEVQNDVQNVSHDYYMVVPNSPSPGGVEWIPDFPGADYGAKFFGANVPHKLHEYQAEEMPSPKQRVHTEIEYAVVVCPDTNYADYGDAPDPTYCTMLSSNGARHWNYDGVYEWLGDVNEYLQSGGVCSTVPKVSLERDAIDPFDPDGEPNLNPDDTDHWDDGVLFYPPYNYCQIESIDVLVSTSGLGAARYADAGLSLLLHLRSWWDFNDDGDWADTFTCSVAGDAPEHVIWLTARCLGPDPQPEQVVNNQRFTMDPSTWANSCRLYRLKFLAGKGTTGQIWTRFRLNYCEPYNDSDCGFAAYGEVEDYLVDYQGIVEPVPPEGLGCTPHERYVELTWTNPMTYDSIGVYRSRGGLPAALLVVLPGSPATYRDSSVCCTGNYDYHLTGFRSDLESDPSTTCWAYKLGNVHHFWDFNESDQGWTPMQDPNSWQWGAASGPHDPGEPTCPDSGVGTPVPLTSYWGTVIGGPYLPFSCCRLFSPPAELDSCALLEICHWYQMLPPDGGNVKVSTDGGATWNLIYPCEGYPGILDADCYKTIGQPGYTGFSPGWVLDYFDLAAFGYANSTVQIAFDFGAMDNPDLWPGWYIKWAKVYTCEECPCGDCNGDGRITVADATYIVSYIYRGGPGMVCDCDVNLDTRLTVADATYIVSYIYRGGPPPCNPPMGYLTYSAEQATLALHSPRSERR